MFFHGYKISQKFKSVLKLYPILALSQTDQFPLKGEPFFCETVVRLEQGFFFPISLIRRIVSITKKSILSYNSGFLEMSRDKRPLTGTNPASYWYENQWSIKAKSFSLTVLMSEGSVPR